MHMNMMTFLMIQLVTAISWSATCPDLTGRYMDEENVRIEIKQSACSSVEFISQNQKTFIQLDKKSRAHEKGQFQESFISGYFTPTEIKLEQIIQDKNSPGQLVYQMFLTYKFQDSETLVEETLLYNRTGKLIDQKTMNLFRIKSAK